MQFEGQDIGSYDDLLIVELNENGKKVKELEAKMEKMAKIEKQSREYFKKEYNKEHDELDEMMKELRHDEGHLDKL